MKMDPKNYYVHVSVQAESDVEALEIAAKIAQATGEFTELNRCGTKDNVCIVSPDGMILFKKRT